MNNGYAAPKNMVYNRVVAIALRRGGEGRSNRTPKRWTLHLVVARSECGSLRCYLQLRQKVGQVATLPLPSRRTPPPKKGVLTLAPGGGGAAMGKVAT